MSTVQNSNRATWRAKAAVATLAAGGLVLAGCAEDSPRSTDASGSSTVENPYELADVKGELLGFGASSQKLFMDNQVAPALSDQGIDLSYMAGGSIKGKKALVGDQVSFASSDVPLSERAAKDVQQRCEGEEAWHLPIVISPIAVAYRLDGVEQELNLPVQAVADIFSGKITKWDDPRIAKANPGVELPGDPIEVVYRSDQSGVSEVFQDFLATATDGEWKTKGGAFPTEVGVGANGPSGAADATALHNGSITYSAAPFLKGLTQLKAAKVDFGAGATAPTTETVNAALDKTRVEGTGNNLVLDAQSLYKANREGQYPLTLTTYEIVCSAGYDEQTQGMVQNLLHTMLAQQQGDYEAEGYVPLRGALKEMVESAIDEIGAE